MSENLAKRSEYLQPELSRFARVRRNIGAGGLTTFSLGGVVSLVVEVESVENLQNILRLLSANQVKWRLLGAGSNVLIADSGLAEVIIKLSGDLSHCGFVDDRAADDIALLSMSQPIEFNQSIPPEQDNVFVFVGAGASLMGVSRRLCQLGLSGLEFAAGIPAQIGGAVRMNAGAHNHSMSDVVESVFMVNSTGDIYVRTNSEMGFSYRHTSIGDDMVLVGAVLRMRRGSPESVKEERNRCLTYRKATQPLHLPSAGSVFINPGVADGRGEGMKIYAAQLLEAVGLKGLRSGGVMFSEMHANWLVKVGGEGTANEAIGLMERAERRVKEELGVSLRREIIVWGDGRENR